MSKSAHALGGMSRIRAVLPAGLLAIISPVVVSTVVVSTVVVSSPPPASAVTAADLVTVVAGTGASGIGGDGIATSSALSGPTAIAVAVNGNLYIADSSNHRIQRVDTVGNVTTVAGTGVAGSGGSELNRPSGLALDNAGFLYISDTGNNRIQRVDAAGNVATVAGAGTAIAPSLSSPLGLAIDGHGGLYIADSNNGRIVAIDTQGQVSLIGDGSLHHPSDVDFDVAGTLYVSDDDPGSGHRILRLGPDGTLVGVGEPYDGSMGAAGSIVVDRSNIVYTSSNLANSIFRRTTAGGNETRLLGTGSPGIGAGINGPASTFGALMFPAGLASDGLGSLLVADTGNHRILKIAGTNSLSPRPLLTGDYAYLSGIDASIARLYRATFSRQPEADGFDYWTDQYSQGKSLDDMAAFFVVSPEFNALYGDANNTEFIDLMYANVIGRPAEQSGFDYWLNRLESGELSRRRMLLLFSDGLEFRLLTQSD